MAPDDLIGFQRLARIYGLQLVQPLFSTSRIGGQRKTEAFPTEEHLVWPAHYRPEDSFRGHVEFGLKYERFSLEFFSRLFEAVDPQEIVRWLEQEPTGRYARRTAFLYEWLTGKALDVPDTAPNVPYALMLDAERYLTRTTPKLVRRWRIKDNLPGVPAYCPLVYIGPPETRDWLYDVGSGIEALDSQHGAELLRRSAAWMTFKESQASFAIEREADKADRVRRFAAAIQEYSGKLSSPLDAESLATLQAAVLGDATLQAGLRQSPVFVGQTTLRAQIVHYIAPDPSWVEDMLAGLEAFERQTRGADPVVRAAAVSFAFVYLHPLADGNGRVHRFLINHILAFDGAVPSHVVVPISATISGSARGKVQYDTTLELFSKPLMKRYATAYRFGARRQCPDGMHTNFEFLATEDAAHAWRYPDLTAHARYLSAVLQQTVEEDMAAEAILLRQYDQATERLKAIIEMPDQSASRIITSLQQQHWRVSNRLRKEFPDIFEENGRFFHLKDSVIECVREMFESDEEDQDGEDDEDAGYRERPRR